MIISLMNRPMSSSAKISWMLLITAMPLSGTLFYVWTTVEMGYGTTKHDLVRINEQSKKYIRKETYDACKVSVTDKDGNDVFITIEEGNFFSRCFTGCDANQNGKVTYAEAAEATTLSLHFGGRSNVIDNYDFLRFFPKLVRLHLGNTTVEGIDLSHNILLEEVNMEEALWLRVVKVAGPVLPKFYCPADVKIMTILVGDSVKMPSNPDQLNLEKYLDFSEEGIVSEKKD